MRRLSLLLPLLAAILLATAITPAQAQVPDDAAWVLRADVSKLWESPLGQVLRQQAKAENGDRMQQQLDAATQAMGLDPRKDIGEMVAWGSDYDKGDATMVIELKNPGNIESWAPMADGYQSEKLSDDVVLHSFLVPDNSPAARREMREQRGATRDGGEADRPRGRMGRGNRGERGPQPTRRMYAALPQVGDDVLMIASTQRDAVTKLVDKAEDIDVKVPGDQLLELSVNKMPAPPENRAGEPRGGPESALVQSLDSAKLTISSGTGLEMRLAVEAKDADKAEQVLQMMQGLKALVALGGGNDPQARPMVELVQAMEIEKVSDGNAVIAELSWDRARLERWVKDAAAARQEREGGREGERE